jgi:hypothetical protein
VAALDDLKALYDALASMLLTDALAEKTTVEAGGTIRVTYSAGGRAVQWTGSREKALKEMKDIRGLIQSEEIPEANVRLWS